MLAGWATSSFVQSALCCNYDRQIDVQIQFQRDVKRDVDEVFENDQFVFDGQRRGRWNLEEQLVKARLTTHDILALHRVEVLLNAVVSIFGHKHLCAIQRGSWRDRRATLVHGDDVQTNFFARIVAFSSQRSIDLHISLINIADLFAMEDDWKF